MRLLWRHAVQRLRGVEEMIEDEPQTTRVMKEGQRENDCERHPKSELLIDR
jgi:hypothetical protein